MTAPSPASIGSSSMPGPGERVAVLGAGVIGAGWAAFFALSGLDVRVYDIGVSAESSVMSTIERARPVMAALGLLSDRPTIPVVTSDLEHTVATAVHIQETIPENLEMKRRLYAEVESFAPSTSVIASSSSALKPSLLQAGMAHPGRFLVAHPCNPPYLMPVVEIVGGELTQPWAIESARRFYEALGKQTVVLRREVVGHLVNRLQAALWREAVHLVVEGVASVAEVDLAVTAGLGARWTVCGPHEIFHLSGGPQGMAAFLERLGPSVETWWDDLGHPRLDPATRQVLIDGMRESAAGRTVDEMALARDRKVVDVMAFLKRGIDQPGTR